VTQRRRDEGGACFFVTASLHHRATARQSLPMLFTTFAMRW
jgi:hypothetical protein